MKAPSRISKHIARVVLALYLMISLFGVLLYSHPHHMVNGVHNCPYAVGENALCATVFDHISGWGIFSRVASSVNVVVCSVVLAFVNFFTLFRPSILFKKARLRFRPLTLMQMLFTQGILNPKAP